MHASSSRISNVLCLSGNEGSFPALPVGSFPAESDAQSVKKSKLDSSNNSQRTSSGNDSSEYREFRLPSVVKLRRNAKMSLTRLRCRGFVRHASGAHTTYDDFTADLYGCDVDDELPLLDDIYIHDEESNMTE
jgi:hypothetical protein